MHVIVGQGQLDSVLQARPEDRRGFIEEAAGVLKHRKRKEKALRKLEAMQANLTRLTDLTAELRRQLKPLGKQAEIARRAAGVQAELRDSRLRLLADDLVRLRGELDREVADEEAIRARRAEVEAALDRGAGARVRRWSRRSPPTRRVLAKAQETWYRLSALEERFRGTALARGRAGPPPVRRARRGARRARPGGDGGRGRRGARPGRRAAVGPRRLRTPRSPRPSAHRQDLEQQLAEAERALVSRRGLWPTGARAWPSSPGRSTRCGRERPPAATRSRDSRLRQPTHGSGQPSRTTNSTVCRRRSALWTRARSAWTSGTRRPSPRTSRPRLGCVNSRRQSAMPSVNARPGPRDATRSRSG